ncbi:hypothetical protein LQU92_13125 [Kocuria sp. LUK]|uniref:hypothetical protein n=1 Tax=Kocuria sp. LUK TaxID=2897828 RepID=UPI001E518D25|nr:hypothetical protein [Kocuria sp. LUK]MCD1146167.1 hypothetical protein [Kocuria sp. LUK]
MPSTLPARRPRLLAAAVLAGTTAVAGPLLTAAPAAALPVAIDGTAVDVPEGAPATGPEHYFTPVSLSNGDTGYGLDEDQPLAPLGEDVLDDEHYAVAQPVDDPDGGWTQVVGERAGNTPVYWERDSAALAGYLLSVFGATSDAHEALAVHWAVRSLATAETPDPELSGLEDSHLERAAAMLEDARRTVPVLQAQEDGAISVDTAPDGSPERLLVELPEVSYATTVALDGPATFADGIRERSFGAESGRQVLDLAVPAGTTEGELTVTVTATTPTTELTVLAHDDYRDLFIAGQDRELSWSASTAFEIAAAPVVPAGDEADDGAAEPTPGADPTAGEGAAAENPDTTDGTDAPRDESSGDGAVRPSPLDDGNAALERSVPVVVVAPEAAQRVEASLEAFVLFEESTSTHTETVTETTTTVAGSVGSSYGAGYGTAYAEAVTADTGTGGVQPAAAPQQLTTGLLALLAVGAGLGSWALRRRPADPDPAS